MQVSVVIPSYRRPEAVARCVASLGATTPRPDQVIVVCREDDRETLEAVARVIRAGLGLAKLRVGTVKEAGHIPPVERGLGLASGEIVAIVDDDTTVDERWLGHLIAHFRDPRAGVVGGRVVVPGGATPRPRGRPGRVSWYGKTWGNVASVEGGQAFEVDTVMECNWAWRRDLLRSIRIDAALNFDDASMYGLDLCFQAKAKGFRVVYEPRALVYHHVEPRVPELDRAQRGKRIFSYCRNYTYIMLKRLPWWRRAAFLVWWFGIGERNALGAAALLAEILGRGRGGRREFRPALAGKIHGVRLWLRNRGAVN